MRLDTPGIPGSSVSRIQNGILMSDAVSFNKESEGYASALFRVWGKTNQKKNKQISLPDLNLPKPNPILCLLGNIIIEGADTLQRGALASGSRVLLQPLLWFFIQTPKLSSNALPIESLDITKDGRLPESNPSR